MDQIARKPRWNVRGPYRVGEFVRKRTGGGPAGNTWSDYWYGKSRPNAETMRRFAEAFECEGREIDALAYARAFREATAA